MKIAVLGLLVVMTLLVSGCTEPVDRELNSARISAEEWLSTEMGMEKFPGGVAEKPIRFWNERDMEVLYWLVPVKDGDAYTGYITSGSGNFTTPIPNQITVFGTSRAWLFNVTRSEAYQQMIAENQDYASWQIEPPILLARVGSFPAWYSEIKAGNEVVKKLYIDTFIG